MGLVETIIPRPTQPHTAHTLRECPFNACSSGILLEKLRRLLFLSSRLQGRMRRLRTQMQHPTGRLGARTVAAHRTASTHLRSKDHFDTLACSTPARTLVSLRARRSAFLANRAGSVPHQSLCLLWLANCYQTRLDPAI